MSKQCENKVREENRSFPCTRHLILRHHINVFWWDLGVRGWGTDIKKSDCIVCAQSSSHVRCCSCHSNRPPLQWLAQAWKWRKGTMQSMFSPSSRPFCKAPREGRLVSAASQKVPDRVPGDTECYHCLDSLKKDKKAYEKKRGRKQMTESTETYTKVSQFFSYMTTLELFQNFPTECAI